ncbi:MAG: PLP-dependent aminotransferase family protein [bacterium]
MPPQGFLYENVADNIARRIGSGALLPGERMPSLRALSRELGISISTVMQAYGILESRGLIETLPQSGHFVRRSPQRSLELPSITDPDIERVSVPGNRMLHDFLRSVANPLHVPLGCAAPSLDYLPVKRLAGIMGRVLREQPEAAMNYQFPPGLPELRRQIALRSLNWMGELSADEILITSGGMDALNLSLQALTKPGDTVAVESPTFFGLLQVLEHHGLRALELPTSPQTGIDLRALDEAAGMRRIAAVLLIPSFSNPLGSLMPEQSRRRLLELAGRHDFTVIEDDIYGELHYSGRRPVPIRGYDNAGRVVLCSSFSKSLAPGLRIGWIAASGQRRLELEQLQFNSTIGAPSLQQLALAEFLASGAYDAHLRRFRRSLRDCMEQCSYSVREHFPRGTRLTRPSGGYVLWIELPAGLSGLRLFQAALAEGISIAPGPIFTSQARYASCIRLNAALQWNEQVGNAIRRLGELARELG